MPKNKTPTDAIALLKADHRKVEGLFEKFDSAKRSERKMALAKENFDRWVFDGTNSEQTRKAHLHSILSTKITLYGIGRVLKPEQIEKLRLAGSGDIKRFFDRVEESRSEFEAVRKDYNAGRLALNQLEPLSSEYQVGPFGPGSFLEKTLRKMETDAKGASRGEK